MTHRRFAKLATMFGLGIIRLIGLIGLLAAITSLPPVAQLVLLPAGLALILARYVFQLPQFRWRRVFKSRISPTWAAEPSPFANARERATLLLRRPPSFARLVLAMVLIAAVVPFAWGVVGGVCARGELIRINSGLPSTDASAGRVIQLIVGVLTVVWFVLMEEFVMRGWLLFPLRKLLNAPIAIAITSYLFAVMHLVPAMGLNLLLGGIIVGTAAVLSGSIWYPVGLHLAHNFGVFAWDSFFDAFAAGAVSCTGSRPAFLILTTSLFYVLWIGRRRRPTFAKARITQTTPQ